MVRRMASALRAMSHIHLSVVVLVDPEPGVSPLSIRHACSVGIERLQQGPDRLVYGWMDRRLYAQGFSDGALWIYGNKDTERQMEHLQSNPQRTCGESIRPVSR